MCMHIFDLVPKGVHENRTKGVENKVDDTLKLAVFLECAQCYFARKDFLKAIDENLWRYLLTKVIKGCILYIRYYNKHSSHVSSVLHIMHKIKSHY